MGNYKFYTPPAVAQCLIDVLPGKNYSNIIDICCGSWNLLKSAKNRFTQAHCVGVDIDEQAAFCRIEDAEFHCEDGRLFAIKEKRKFDLILSNPPFGYLEEKKHILNKQCESTEIIKELLSNRYENEMMQANLLMVHDGSVLLFILPITFLAGDTYLEIRKKLYQNFQIESIIKLPVETFGSRKINTFALIMIKNKNRRKSTKIEELIYQDDGCKIRHVKNVPPEIIETGIWKEEIRHQNKIAVQLFRGNISTSSMSRNGTKIYHCSSKIRDGVWEPSIRYCDDEKKLKNAKMAMRGDIIINRIGRCANYWCVCKENTIVSDCLIVVKSLQKKELYARMKNNSINGRLNIDVKGVTTNYITIKDVLDVL